MSFATAARTATTDTKKESAPVLSGPDYSVFSQPDPRPHALFDWLTFSDADKGNYGGGSLLLQDSTSSVYGGDGQDELGLAFSGTATGQFSFVADTREVKYAFEPSGNGNGIGNANVLTVAILDPVWNGHGTDLKLVFTSNATHAVVDLLIDHLQFTNTDDTPTLDRLFALTITDPTGNSTQRVTSWQIEDLTEAPALVGVPMEFQSA